jgi:hypothetical protein
MNCRLNEADRRESGLEDKVEEIFYFLFIYFYYYSFIHMCIHCLGHFFPLSPFPTPSPVTPSVPGRSCSASIASFIEKKTQA